MTKSHSAQVLLHKENEESSHHSRKRQARWLRGQKQLPRKPDNLTSIPACHSEETQLQMLSSDLSVCIHSHTHGTHAWHTHQKPHAVMPPHPTVCNHFSTSQALKIHLLWAPKDKPKWCHYRKLGFCIPNGGKKKRSLQELYGHDWFLGLISAPTPPFLKADPAI